MWYVYLQLNSLGVNSECYYMSESHVSERWRGNFPIVHCRIFLFRIRRGGNFRQHVLIPGYIFAVLFMVLLSPVILYTACSGTNIWSRWRESSILTNCLTSCYSYLPCPIIIILFLFTSASLHSNTTLHVIFGFILSECL